MALLRAATVRPPVRREIGVWCQKCHRAMGLTAELRGGRHAEQRTCVRCGSRFTIVQISLAKARSAQLPEISYYTHPRSDKEWQSIFEVWRAVFAGRGTSEQFQALREG